MPPIEIDDTWSMARGADGERRRLLRFRQRLRHLVGHPALTHRLSVTWHYFVDEGERSGLPTPAQQAEMEAFEDRLVDALEGDGATPPLAVLTEVTTGDGRREWVWYTAPVPELEECINLALAPRADFPIRLEIEPDPKWSGYTRLLDSFGM